ncbi:MAG: hypothetical protein P4K86_10395 [Terracidiphilus sp.]|nr:hypothetical protein [Terracidiphilus sp.]
MAQREVITEAMIQAALEALDGRIAIPPPPAERKYSRREAFAKLRAKAREALAAGHTLETVLDDLKGVGLGMTIATARQYLKPGRKTNKARGAARPEPLEKPVAKPAVTASVHVNAATGNTVAAKKGTFAVIEDDNDI